MPWYEFTCENTRCRCQHRYFRAGPGRCRKFCNEFCRRGQNRRNATLAFVAAMRALREERLAAGLCPSCGEPAAPGRVLCEHHLEYHRNLKRALRRDKRADGLCIYASCDRLAVKGGYCMRHYLQVEGGNRRRAA